MPHSCHGGYLDIPLYRPLHTLGFQDIYSNGIFSRGNNLYEESRVCKIGFSRVLSTQAIATEKEAEEEDKITSKGFPDSLYKRISRLRDPKRTVVELESWIREGGEANRWRLRNIVKALRKYHQYMHALKIFQWMRKKISFSSGEHAIHLDLIAKVYGIVRAEKYFADLPDNEKNQPTYSALLNCYVKEKNIEKSEATLQKLKELGFAKSPLPFNEMMTLYINTQQFEKVPWMIWEMKKNGLSLDKYSYNFWMKSYAALSDLHKVEEVLNEMERDDNVVIDWNIHCTLVNIYMKAKVLDKAESVLKEMENKMKEMEAKTTRKYRLAYDHLISFHASLGNRAEVYRIWKSFELAFPKITNRSYYCFLNSLVRIGDIEGAEDFLKKWESMKLLNDIRVAHVLLLAYIKNGWLQKAELLLDRVLENGVKPTASTWEILAQGYIQNEQFDKALEAMTKSLSVRKTTSWQRKSGNVLAILKHFEKQGDVKSAEGFCTIKGVKFVSTKVYNSLLRTNVHVGKVPPKIKSSEGR